MSRVMSFRDYLSEARQIFDKLYPNNQITEVDYEGPTIVVYTKDENLFSKREDLAKQIAQEIRCVKQVYYPVAGSDTIWVVSQVKVFKTFSGH